MGKRGPQPSTEIEKANRGSDHVDKNALQMELASIDKGSPFDLLGIDYEVMSAEFPLLAEYVKECLEVKAENKEMSRDDTLAMRLLLKAWMNWKDADDLKQELRVEYKRQAAIIMSKQFFMQQKAYLAQAKLTETYANQLLSLLKEFGLTPKERNNIPVPSGHGNEKQSKKERFG